MCWDRQPTALYELPNRGCRSTSPARACSWPLHAMQAVPASLLLPAILVHTGYARGGPFRGVQAPVHASVSQCSCASGKPLVVHEHPCSMPQPGLSTREGSAFTRLWGMKMFLFLLDKLLISPNVPLCPPIFAKITTICPHLRLHRPQRRQRSLRRAAQAGGCCPCRPAQPRQPALQSVYPCFPLGTGSIEGFGVQGAASTLDPGVSVLGPHVLEIAAVLHDVGGHGVDQEARAPILWRRHLDLRLCTAPRGLTEYAELSCEHSCAQGRPPGWHGPSFQY